MIAFSTVTPFSLVRSIGVAGGQNPAIYLLICDSAVAKAVQADLAAEVEVQLGSPISVKAASAARGGNFESWHDGKIRVLHFDEWLPDLVDALDRHSAHLVQDGGQLFLLVDGQAAERILRGAPNLRSRLTDVFQISPEDLSGEHPA